MIRKIEDKDIDTVMDIWLKSTIKAHDFIPEEYWEANFGLVKDTYIPMSDTFVYEHEKMVKGFISIINNEFIGALFVDNNYQGCGIGSELIKYACNLYHKLTLTVYKDNIKSVQFYKKNKFKIISEGINEDSKYDEYTMEYYKMNITIREELEKDYKEVQEMVKKSFEGAEHTDNNEHKLVEKLRKSDNFIKELSIVAEKDGKIIGHIMSTRLDIVSDDKIYVSLATAPLSVHTDYQKMGIGSLLMKETFRVAKELGYESIFILGSEKYYPRFGFKKSTNFGISAPFEVPSENFMAIELIEGALENVSGNIIYAKEFFEV